jgi:hypothetical protein
LSDRLLFRPEAGSHRLPTVSWPAGRGPVVKPGLVRACVEEVLRRGWLVTHTVLDPAVEEVPLPAALPAWPIASVDPARRDGFWYDRRRLLGGLGR